MNYKFYTNSEKAWKVMFQSIAQAKESIYLEMYILEDDMPEFNFFKVLKEKAKQGLRVRLILDSFGSINLSRNKIIELQKSGIEIFFLSYLLHRIHRKVLIIDETVAFIGGVNFHQTAHLWDDLVVQIKGILVVSVVMSFAKSYINSGGKDPILLGKKSKINISQLKVWIIEHSPIKKHFNLKRIYKKNIDNAKSKIVIITPYFMPKRWVQADLHQAILRGVIVEVLVPKYTDYFLIDRVNYFYINKLSKLGITFFLEPKMNHAKAMIIDNDVGIVGSQNLDFLSFDFNSEIGVFFKDKYVVTKLSGIAENWKKDALTLSYTTYKPKWFDYILSPIVNLFSMMF